MSPMARDGASAPLPSEVWRQAQTEHPLDFAARRQRYFELMREHGYLLRPGDEGYEQGVRPGCVGVEEDR